MSSEDWNPTPSEDLPADYLSKAREAANIAEARVVPLTSVGEDGFQGGGDEEFLNSVLCCADAEGVPIPPELDLLLDYLTQFQWIMRPAQLRA